jgi:hypothetical protein
MSRFSRRTLLRRGSLGALVLAGGGAAAFELAGTSAAPVAPRPRLERGVALGPFFAGRPEQRYESNRHRLAETGTTWVRFWADWPRLQPQPELPPHAGTAAHVVAALDAQIDMARADGHKVMLTAWRFPRWANGTLGATVGRVEPEYRLPGDLSPDGAWARWIDYLLGRYSGRIDALEIMNEPNLQMWPQRGVVGAVADMMETALEVASGYDDAPLLVAPATGDTVERSEFRTPYDSFTRALLARLEERRFRPGARFAWSHHNYTDVESDLAGSFNRAAHVRAMLAAGRWGGRPELLITESGARPAVVAERFGLPPDQALLGQAEVLRRNLWRMTVGPEGEGVALLCQYLFVTDYFYDSGLCELDGTPRPAYFAWAGAAG